MLRIVISLDPEDKHWLKRQAKESKTTIAALVRKAVKQMRQQEQAKSIPFEQLLISTKGLWQGDDGLVYQQSLRDEWS